MQSALTRSLILVALALLGAVAFYFAPDGITRFPILPSPPKAPIPYVTFFNSDDSLASQVGVKPLPKGVKLDILLQAKENKDSWAGIGWTLKDANWMFMDTLFIRVRGTGIHEAQVKLLTFDPDHSDPKNPETFRQVLKEIPIREEWQTLAIPTEQLYVPEWWYTQQNVSRDLDSKHLEKVARFDILTSNKAPHNTPITLELETIEASGVSKRNVAILLSYWFILMIFAIGANPNKQKPR